MKNGIFFQLNGGNLVANLTELQHMSDNSMQTFLRTCRDHPAQVNESYWQHMKFAAKMSGRLFKASAAAMLHSVVPACCETTASREICAMHEEISKRNSAG